VSQIGKPLELFGCGTDCQTVTKKVFPIRRDTRRDSYKAGSRPPTPKPPPAMERRASSGKLNSCIKSFNNRNDYMLYNSRILFYRCMLGQGSGPAQWPNICRIVEAVCLELCSIPMSLGLALLGTILLLCPVIVIVVVWTLIIFFI